MTRTRFTNSWPWIFDEFAWVSVLFFLAFIVALVLWGATAFIVYHFVTKLW